MAGLRMICKLYGGMRFRGADGKIVEYLWDYAKDRPVIREQLREEAWERKEEKRKKREEFIKKQGVLF